MLIRRSLGKQAAAGALAATTAVLAGVVPAGAEVVPGGQVSGVAGAYTGDLPGSLVADIAKSPYLDAYGNELPRNADGTTLTYVDVSGILGQVGERVKLDNDHREYTVMKVYSEWFAGLDDEYWRTGLKPVAPV